MRYFNYGSWQTDANRQAYPQQFIGGGGNKLGVLQKELERLGGPKGIEYAQTTIKQGTWGWIAPPTNAEKKANAEPGKVAGLLCVRRRGLMQFQTTLWYQIGVDHNGKAFAELGWQVGLRKGSMLQTYDDITVTDDMVLRMVPKETTSTAGTSKISTVEFVFKTGKNEIKKTLTWVAEGDVWNAGAREPGFEWNDMHEVNFIRVQIEAHWPGRSIWSEVSQMTLPGTKSNPVEFDSTEYQEKPSRNRITGKMEQPTETIDGDKFEKPQYDNNDKDFEYSSEGKKVKMWSKTQFKPEEQN